MPRRRHDPDPNSSVARVVRETTAAPPQELVPDIEAAWAAWAGSLQKVDARTKTLLRAAFEAGAEAGAHYIGKRD